MFSAVSKNANLAHLSLAEHHLAHLYIRCFPKILFVRSQSSPFTNN